MRKTTRECSFSKEREGEYESWLMEATPWKRRLIFEPGKDFCFFNPITRKLTVMPMGLLGRNILYFPTNSPGTGEHFVPMILAVNGECAFNYDEDEHRFDDKMEYIDEEHSTRVDIFVCRQAKRK